MVERNKSVFITVRVSPATEEAVDAYRRAQDLIPSRADAIEKLIILGYLDWLMEKEKKDGKTS